MVWRKASEKQVGGNYTWWDAEFDSPNLLPLLYCIGNAIPARPLDYWLRRIFPASEPQYAGGDPGWEISNTQPNGELRLREDGSVIYHAWTDEDISGLDPCEGDYDEQTVKLHACRTLLSFIESHPERKTEAEEVIARYNLHVHLG